MKKENDGIFVCLFYKLITRWRRREIIKKKLLIMNCA